MNPSTADSTANTVALLQAAVAELRWVSESEAPFVVGLWPPLVAPAVAAVVPTVAPVSGEGMPIGDPRRSAVDHSAPTPSEPTVQPLAAAPTAPLSPAQLRQLLHLPADCPIEALTVEALLGYAAQSQSWHSAAEAATAKRYQALIPLLNAELTNLQVFRVGAVNVEIYVIGQARSGDWLCLQTRAVET
jgi:Nuclease A inhibitor-like protein